MPAESRRTFAREDGENSKTKNCRIFCAVLLMNGVKFDSIVYGIIYYIEA